MTDDQWARVKALFHGAVERPAADRSAFLAAAAAGDETVRREVESLLASDAAPVAAVDEWPLGAEGTPSDLRMAITEPMEETRDTHVLSSGFRIGSYEVGSLLGSGAMGEVYRARDTKLNRDVALKVLPRTFALDPDRLARFRREAQVLAALNHPHIAAIYGFEEADGLAALVLELVEGATLADRIAQGPVPVDEALAVSRQIADAVETAHDKGIIHRDLKPSNIKIAVDGAVKVLDFGLAKSDIPGGPPDLTASGAGLILGTASYMSPEQARGHRVDKRADIWALGCVLYEMLTGRLAFPGSTVSDTIAKILEREPDWSALPPAIPLSIRRLLLRCLKKDPRQRLRDIGEVRIEIDAIDEVAPAVSDSDASATARASPLPWTAFAALVVGAIAASAVWKVVAPATTPEDPLANAKFSRITDWEGNESGAQISPDGRFVVFLADRDGKFDLWVSQVGTEDFRNLTADLPALGGPHSLIRRFGFSGDGAAIWFSVESDPVQSQKLIIPITGGTPRPFLAKGDAAPSWSSDGTRLAYFHNSSGDPLLLADRTGGDAHEIEIRPPNGLGWSRGAERIHNHNPVWSPSDQWLYFVHGFQRQLDWTDEMDVWRIRPAGGSPERMTQQGTTVTFLASLDRRTLLFIARALDGSGPWLWALDTETKVTRRANAGLEQYNSVASSADGRRVVATVVHPTASLWSVPILKQPAEDRDVQPYPVPTARALAPRFGGRSLFYLSSHGTADGLWRFSDGRAAEIRRGTDGALLEPPALSPDGSRVTVVLAKDRRRRLAIMSAEGTGLRGLAESIDVQGGANWSPDGTTIVVGGNDDQLGSGLFKIPVDGGAVVRLVSGQATNPVWSPNGNLIVYAGALVTGQVAPLFGVRPDGSRVELPPLQVRPGGHRFMPDGQGLVFLPRSQSLDFWLLDLDRKTTRQLTRLSSHGRLGRFDVTPGFDITPDARQIVFDRVRENSDIVLIDRPRQ
jgi:serine/threonine protein kinase/Tol biopolymer transport system component